jgi:hypothetical protein
VVFYCLERHDFLRGCLRQRHSRDVAGRNDLDAAHAAGQL